MALRASEILLILRAKNQASMTIRRVAKDVQFLGRTVKANQAGFDMMQRGRGHAVGGAAMTHVGGAASLIGAGTLAGLGAASKSFADFDKMSTQAATQIGNINNSVEDVTANSERLRKAILAQMAQFPSTASEMSDAAYDIFSSMDVGFNKGIGLLKLFNQAAVAGMTDVATAGNGAITVLNNFDPALEHPKKTLNEMFSIIRFGRIDLATLNTMMNQIAPAAAAADQSLGDISGAIATLTRRLGPSVASAGLARLFEIFQRKDFQAGMAKAGVAITDAQGQLLPLEEILKRLMALGPRPGKTLQNLIQSITAFGSGKGGVQATVQARRALVTLIKNYKDYIDIQDRSTKNTDQFDKQLSAMSKSLGVRWGTFVNKLRKDILEIGQDAIPVFEEMGTIIGPVIKAWENLGTTTKAFIVTTTGMVALFTLLGGLVLSFAGILRGLYGIMLMTSGVIRSRFIPDMIAWGQLVGGSGRAGIAYGLQSIAMSAARLAAMPAIGIGIALMMKGGEWNTVIGGLLAGAGAGFMLGGPVGAVVGAVTVPIILKIIKDIGKPPLGDKPGLLSDKELKGQIKELKDEIYGFNPALPMDKKWYDKQVGTLKKLEGVVKARNQAMLHNLPAGSIAEIAQEAAKNTIPRTGEDVSRGITDNIKKHTKNANDTLKTGMFKDALTIDQVNKKVAAKLKENEKTLKDWAKQRAGVMQQANDSMKQALDTAVSNLSSTYDQIQQANESAMGELFQGPFLTGETFNLAEEWGVTAGIKDINKDLKDQIAEFNKWHGALRAIGARGAPKELLQSLEALGPDAVDKLETLRKASPKMFNNFVRLWQQRQNAIKRETKMDFTAQLKEWNKYGKDIAFQIISGLRGENVTLEKGFEKYISANFSGALNKIKTDALKEFYQENPEARKAAKNAAAIRKAAAARKAQIKEGDKTTIHIHQKPGEDGTAVAKRTAWETAHRKGRGKTKVPAGAGHPPVRSHPTVRGGD